MKENKKENSVIAKINRYGKVGKIITTIMMIIASVGTVTTIVSGIALLVMPSDFFELSLNTVVQLSIDTNKVDAPITENDQEMIEKAFNSGLPTGLNLGAVRFSMDQAEFVDGKLIARSEGNETNISLNSLGYAVIAAAVALILTSISLLFGRKLCKAFEKCETPFEENVIKRLEQFAISLLPWALYSSVPESIMNSVLNNSLKMNLSINLSVIFTVLVIFALSTVFKYGAVLQRESDETL